MIAPPEIEYPSGLAQRIARRARACARRLRQMRRECLCEPDVLVWPEWRREAFGTVTNVRFRLGSGPDAIRVDATTWEARLAATLQWHAHECFIRDVICNEMGTDPLLGTSDEELSAILDVLVLDPRMSAWACLAEAEWDARIHESAHRKLSRHLAARNVAHQSGLFPT